MVLIKDDFTDPKMIKENFVYLLDKDNLSFILFARYIFKNAKCFHCHKKYLKTEMKRPTDRNPRGWEYFCLNCVPKYKKDFPGMFD